MEEATEAIKLLMFEYLVEILAIAALICGVVIVLRFTIPPIIGAIRAAKYGRLRGNRIRCLYR